MLHRCFLLSLGLLASTPTYAAQPIVLRCAGHQVGIDSHKLADQIISLDLQNNMVVSVELQGHGSKDVINSPLTVSKIEIHWVYESIGFKYVLNKNDLTLELRTLPGELLGKFVCETKDKIP